MKRFGTFEGVFTPCLLSILGVIMYLRLGWVVGQVGLLQAVLIIVMANAITLATALSMSSIVTNIRIGTGGAHSIIAKSLGVEAGGAIGIPLYLSQALSVAFYITGFTECWVSVFPQNIPLLVSILTWFVLLLVTYISAKLAFQLQYVIMAMIGLSLVSVFLGRGDLAAHPAIAQGLWGTGFWKVFAIFFPAVTGVLAGAAMSGELTNPRESIPKGTLAAVGVSFLVYLAMATWLGTQFLPATLVAKTTILIDSGRWQWLVIAGIMGATISSGLSMFVGSPRTLMALGKHDIVPLAPAFARTNARGEPSTAILMTAILALITILLGNLDSVAGLLTMFFLITYGMINFSVFVEQSIGIASFRPTFRIPRLIPFFGAVGCLGVMFLINFTFSLVAFVIIVIIYFILMRREIKVHSPDVRSGLLIFLSEYFAKQAAKLPYHPKIWKPNLLVMFSDLRQLEAVLGLIRAIVFPAGRIIFAQPCLPPGSVGTKRGQRNQVHQQLFDLVQPLKDDGLIVEECLVEAEQFATGGAHILQAVRNLFFPPNTFFALLDDDAGKDMDLSLLLRKAEENDYGVVLLKYHQANKFIEAQVINLWIRRQTPNIDLSILMALQLKENWDAQLRIVQIVADEGEQAESHEYLLRLKKLMRLPEDVETQVLVGRFQERLAEAPEADLNIFGMPAGPDLALFRSIAQKIDTSVLFLRDSEHESALA